MGELAIFFLRLGIALLCAVLTGILSTLIARSKGRDMVGWFFNGFFPGIVGFLILVFAFPGGIGWMLSGLLVASVGVVLLAPFPSMETPGQTKTCKACGRIVRWKAATCPGCRAALEVSKPDKSIKVKRPLRAFYRYLFLFILLLLVVFGFIGYYCVPDQPQASGALSLLHASDIPLQRQGS